MAKQKKKAQRNYRSTIGINPLDQLEQIPTRGKRKAKFKDASAQSEIKDVLLKRPQSQKSGTITKWLKSVLGKFS